MASVKFGLEEIITCGICFELFNEDCRCPRILFCGHTYCHSCLDKILKQSPSCPTCKTGIHIETTELIPVNFTVKSMISVFKNVNENESQNCSIPILTPSSSAGKLESEGYCSDHSYFKELRLRCMDCESWICGMCAALHHKHCRTLLVKEAYKELKKQVSDKVKVELATMNSLSLEITESLIIFNQERKELIEEIKNKKKELKVKEKSITELKTQKSEGNKFCEKLKNIESSIENSTDDSEFSKLINEMEDLLVKGKTLIALIKGPEMDFPKTIKNLQHLCQKQSIFVVEEEAEPLYGMVRVKDDRVWISSFQTKKPKACLLPFKELMSNFGSPAGLPKRAFLQLTPEGDRNDHIEVVIDTDGDSARGKNFILLCSALKGQKYKGMTLQPLSDFYHLSPGPPPVVEGIRYLDSMVPWKEGLVSGMMEGDSYFNLSLKDVSRYNNRYSRYNDCKIGFIVSGLQKLKEFPGGNLTISDCGFII